MIETVVEAIPASLEGTKMDPATPPRFFPPLSIVYNRANRTHKTDPLPFCPTLSRDLSWGATTSWQSGHWILKTILATQHRCHGCDLVLMCNTAHPEVPKCYFTFFSFSPGIHEITAGWFPFPFPNAPLFYWLCHYGGSKLLILSLQKWVEMKGLPTCLRCDGYGKKTWMKRLWGKVNHWISW
jgi:hypothetical protein